MSTVNMLGVTVNSTPRSDILEKIEKDVKNSKFKIQNSKLKRQKSLIIFTPNPEIIVYANKHPYFKEIVNTGQINIPDGVGISVAAWLIGQPIVNTIAGVDLLEDIVKIGSENAVKIGLIGGKPKVALKALECLQARYQGLKGLAEEGPTVKIKNQKSKIKNGEENLYLDYGGWSMEEFVEKLKKEKVGVLFVGFGFPKQELFIGQLAKQLDNIIFMAVGGGFDYISGAVSRAPLGMRKLGLEWLYRLVRQPWRVKRQMALIEFMWLVLTEKVKQVVGVRR